MYPHLPEFLWNSSEEVHHLFSSISLSISLPAAASLLEACTQTEWGWDSHSACTQTEGGLGCHSASTQTEGLGYHPSLKLLQEANQARAQLEYELLQETQELAEKCKHKWSKQARRYTRRRVQMINQTDSTLQEMLSQAISTEAIKLLPWYVSVVVPLCYISEAASMATHQDKGISIGSEPCPTASDPEPHSSPVLVPCAGLTLPLVMSPLPVFSIPDIPLDSTPFLGHSLAGLTIPPKGKWDHSPSHLPNCLHIKRNHVASSEVKVRSEHGSTWGNDNTPEPTPETRTDSGQQWQESPNPSSSPTGGPADPSDDVAAGSPKSTRDQVSSESRSSRGSLVDSDLNTAFGDSLSCSDTDEISMRMACKKSRKK